MMTRGGLQVGSTVQGRNAWLVIKASTLRQAPPTARNALMVATLLKFLALVSIRVSAVLVST